MSAARRGRRVLAAAAVLAALGAGIAAVVFSGRGRPAVLPPGFPDPRTFEPPLERALEEAEGRAAREPGSAAAWGELGMICHAHGLHAEAVEAYGKAGELDARDPRWPHLLGQVYDLLSRAGEAAAAFEAARALEPRDLVALCWLARRAQEDGRADEARRLYLEAVKVDPRCVAARVGLGQLALQAGVLEMAEKSLLLALDAYPRCGPAHAALAQVYGRQGKESEAAFHRRWSGLGSRIPLDDPWMEAVESRGVSHTALFRRAQRAVSAGEWSEAAAGFRSASGLRPELAEPRYLLGVSLIRAGETEEGLRELETASAAGEKRVEALLQIARVRAGCGEKVAAEAALARAAALAPEDTAVLVAQGDFLRAAGKDAEALAAYDRAARAAPADAAAAAALGEALLRRGAAREAAAGDDAIRAQESLRAGKAFAVFARAQELKPDLPEAYEGAGRAKMQSWELARDPKEKEAHAAAAIEEFQRAVKYFPDRKGAHVSLIRALWSAGRREESIAAIDAARARWPGDAQFERRAPEGSSRAE
jgi:predicted Zn-dependent protease